MAAIDKIYGDMEQRAELEAWLEKNLPGAIRHLYPKWDGGGQGTISNFPTWVDKVLFEKCPIEWVREAIEEQYDGAPHGSDYTNDNN